MSERQQALCRLANGLAIVEDHLVETLVPVGRSSSTNGVALSCARSSVFFGRGTRKEDQTVDLVLEQVADTGKFGRGSWRLKTCMMLKPSRNAISSSVSSRAFR